MFHDNLAAEKIGSRSGLTPSAQSTRVCENRGDGARIDVEDQTFTLHQGRVVSLRSLNQWSVYADLLEGLPTRERNDALIQRLLKEEQAHSGHAPLLIVPHQEPISISRRYPFGEPAKLPPVVCVARLHSPEPTTPGSSKDLSRLTVIWFQNRYAFPISAVAEDALRNIDWAGLAEDDQY